MSLCSGPFDTAFRSVYRHLEDCVGTVLVDFECTRFVTKWLVNADDLLAVCWPTKANGLPCCSLLFFYRYFTYVPLARSSVKSNIMFTSDLEASTLSRKQKHPQNPAGQDQSLTEVSQEPTTHDNTPTPAEDTLPQIKHWNITHQISACLAHHRQPLAL